MIEEDLASNASHYMQDPPKAPNNKNSELKTDKEKNFDDELIDKLEIEARKKTNPKKTIGLIFAGCFILLLCCCCGLIFFLPQGYSEQTIEDLCTLLETQGQEAPFGICESEFFTNFGKEST